MKGVLELQQRAGNSLEFIENVKIDLFPDEVYVFTPKGRIMELPKGSTAVDFCLRGAHRRRQQLHRLPHQPPPGAALEPLQSGQTVEIVTARAPGRTRPG